MTEDNNSTQTEKSNTPEELEKPLVNSETPRELSLIEQAEATAKRIEEANKRTEELLRRQEEIATRLLLSGKTQAGIPQKTPEQEEQEQEDKRVKEMLARHGFKTD